VNSYDTPLIYYRNCDITGDFLRQVSRRKFLIGLLLLMTLTGEVFMLRTDRNCKTVTAGRTTMLNHTSNPRSIEHIQDRSGFSGKARSKGAFPRKRTGKTSQIRSAGHDRRSPQLSSRREQALWSPIHVIHTPPRVPGGRGKFDTLHFLCFAWPLPTPTSSRQVAKR